MKELPQTRLDPNSIPKYENQLTVPPIYEPEIVTDLNTGAVSHQYSVYASEFKQQILPDGFPVTTVWGYGGLVKDPYSGQAYFSRSTPGATFEAVRNIPIIVRWINNLKGSHIFAADSTLQWANPNKLPINPPKPWPSFPPGFRQAQYPVPLATHLYGGEVPSLYDGHPDVWIGQNGTKGSAFLTSKYIYPNSQQPATLWYHDNTFGITRLNLYSGLSGFYILRDPKKLLDNQISTVLPTGKLEIPLIIQDRSFNADGSFFFTSVGVNPDIHPYWDSSFFGDTIMVNGKVWPNLNVERRKYRFRILNGSNARFYNLKLSNNQSFVQIGADGGYLPEPVTLSSLLIAPGERADIIVDFSNLDSDTSIIMENDAAAPYPNGNKPNPNTVGQIMRFSVPKRNSYAAKSLPLPNILNTIPKLNPNGPIRILTLNEVKDANGPVELLLNGQKWNAPITELPRVGSTEEWFFVNLTQNTNPIHIHLVQFQILNRQYFDVDGYMSKWIDINGEPPFSNPTIPVDITPYLIGSAIEPDANELGWKDTVRVNPNQVTRIKVRFSPADANPCEIAPGVNLYPFDPTSGPGYVWHSSISHHKDNEMIRPCKLI